MIRYRFVFAGLLSVLALAPQMAAAQFSTRTASADDLAIAKMENVMTIGRWGDGVSITDRALTGCIGGQQTDAQTIISNTCAFPLVIEGVVGGLNNGSCVGHAVVNERLFKPGWSLTSNRIEGELPCLVEVTRLGVSDTAKTRPATIDAAVAVIAGILERGRTELFNASGDQEPKPWTMQRAVWSMSMTGQCLSSFAVPDVIKSEGDGLGTIAKTMGVNWKTVSIVRLFEHTVTFIDGWMKPGEVGIFILRTPDEAEQMAAAFETLALRC